MEPKLGVLKELFAPLLAGIGPEELEQGRDWLRSQLESIAAPNLKTAMIAPDTAFRQDHEGIDGFVDGFGDWLGAFDTFRLELDEVIEIDDGIVTLVRQYATPSGGSIEVENFGVAIWWFRAGLLSRVEFHLDRDTGLRSAGLDPSAYSSQA